MSLYVNSVWCVDKSFIFFLQIYVSVLTQNLIILINYRKVDHFFNIYVEPSPLTRGDERLSTDSGNAAAHVYSSNLSDRYTVPLLPSIRGGVGGAGLSPGGGLGRLAGVLDQ